MSGGRYVNNVSSPLSVEYPEKTQKIQETEKNEMIIIQLSKGNLNCNLFSLSMIFLKYFLIITSILKGSLLPNFVGF